MNRAVHFSQVQATMTNGYFYVKSFAFVSIFLMYSFNLMNSATKKAGVYRHATKTVTTAVAFSLQNIWSLY